MVIYRLRMKIYRSSMKISSVAMKIFAIQMAIWRRQPPQGQHHADVNALVDRVIRDGILDGFHRPSGVRLGRIELLECARFIVLDDPAG